MLDDTDRAILHALQLDARTADAEIARRVGLTAAAVSQRIRRLEESGIVDGYGCALNARALGYGLVAFLNVRTRAGACRDETGSALADVPAVQEVHRVVGGDCFIVKVRVRDTEALATLLEDHIGRIATIASTRTTIVVRTVKEAHTITLPEPA